jgi:hypothetical protein
MMQVTGLHVITIGFQKLNPIKIEFKIVALANNLFEWMLEPSRARTVPSINDR